MLFGQSAVDRSMMTGESVPADAAEGDSVTGGTVALTGRLVVRADKTGKDTQLSQLIRLVEQAQAQKAAVQRAADRVCGVFVPAVLACAALTLAGWLLAGSAAGRAFSAGLAVLIIACPCALGLATPTALVAACGRGARLGIFIKGYQGLETSRSVTVVVLDKTGTVTTGKMSVAGVRPADGVARADLLRYAGAVEQASEHAVAAAISAAAAARGRAAAAGRRVQGPAGTRRPGNRRRPRGHGRPGAAAHRARDDRAGRPGRPVPLLGAGRPHRGADRLGRRRPGSRRRRRHGQAVRGAAVARLRGLGLHPVLLTGDNEATARAVAAQVGIDEVIAGTLPAGKAAVIARLQAQGHQVAMVGDGVNDSPALAAADLGLALGSGTDVAISAADLILLRDDLRCVPTRSCSPAPPSVPSAATSRWAFGYNAAALPLAALGFLNPVIASVAMTLSSAFVVASSLRLQRHRVRDAAPHRGSNISRT